MDLTSLMTHVNCHSKEASFGHKRIHTESIMQEKVHKHKEIRSLNIDRNRAEKYHSKDIYLILLYSIDFILKERFSSRFFLFSVYYKLYLL